MEEKAKRSVKDILARGTTYGLHQVPRIWFFGCWDQRGHYLWGPERRHVPRPEDDLPASLQPHQLDTRYAPRDERQVASRARTTHVDGHTVLAWWDRSVDLRPGSNSALVAEGTWTPEEMVGFGVLAFPQLARRHRFVLELLPLVIE